MVTPQEQQNTLAQELGVTKLYFKREDLHPFESHKGRSIPVMIDTYRKSGKHAFAISSSGNAALAAALYIKELNKKEKESVSLDIYIGLHINAAKEAVLRELADPQITINKVERPLQTVFTKTQDGSVQALRQSNDDTALIGYEELADELMQIKDLSAVFIGSSSGTTAQALAKSFKNKKKKIELCIVQTMDCHPLAEAFTDVMQTDEESLADAIVDKTALRKPVLVPLLKENGGSGYVVTNEEIESAMLLTKKHAGISISPNSALSVAGLMQAVYTGKTWKGSVVCIITGR